MEVRVRPKNYRDREPWGVTRKDRRCWLKHDISQAIWLMWGVRTSSLEEWSLQNQEAGLLEGSSLQILKPPQIRTQKSMLEAWQVVGAESLCD